MPHFMLHYKFIEIRNLVILIMITLIVTILVPLEYFKNRRTGSNIIINDHSGNCVWARTYDHRRAALVMN